jgi:hypothetical protein
LAIANGAQTLVFIVASKSCGAIEERLAHLLARGVVDEDGEAAEARRDVLDQLLARRFVTNVARRRRRLAASVADRLDDLLRLRLLGRLAVTSHVTLRGNRTAPIGEESAVARLLSHAVRSRVRAGRARMR